MKAILSALMITSLMMGSAFAGVKEDVKSLGDLAMGSNVSSFKGSALEMFKAFSEDEEELVYKEIGDIDYSEESHQGFTSAASAAKMNSFAITWNQELMEGMDETDPEKFQQLEAANNELEHKWAPLIKKLDRQGVKFGYSGFGPGYCGISFTKMIIIDEKEHKLYEVYFSDSDAC